MRSLRVLAPCLVALSPVAACPADPGMSALVFYEVHQDFIHPGADSPPLTEELALAVRSNIKSALDKGEVGAIDWNFWTSAQDGNQSKTARVRRVSLSGSRAEVVLAYEFDLGGTSRPRELTASVRLVKAGGKCWLVADLVRGQQNVARLLHTAPAERDRK